MLLPEAAKYTNPSIIAFLRRFSCDCAARSSATPSRQRRAGVNEDTAETSVLRGLARLNRLSLIWLTSYERSAGGDVDCPFDSCSHHSLLLALPLLDSFWECALDCCM